MEKEEIMFQNIEGSNANVKEGEDRKKKRKGMEEVRKELKRRQ